MKNSFDRFIRFNIISAFCLIAVGLLTNQWVLGYLFPPADGSIALESKIIIWAFEIFCIISGLVVYFKGNALDQRKRLSFAFIALALMIITVEIGLHITHFIFNLVDISDKRYLLSPYEGEEWAKALFQEFGEISSHYEQFLGWDRTEYHGEYINVDSQGVRKTWNPEHFCGKSDRIYAFGGSTLWGTGARDEYTISSYLSKLLNNSGYDSIVHNYGETGYTFTQEIIHLILLLREGHKPDYVFFYDGVNDVYGAYQSGMAGNIQNLSIIRERSKEKSNIKLMWIGVTGIFRNHCMIYRAVREISAFFSQQREFQEVASKYSEKELKLLSDSISEHYVKSMELLDRLAQAYGFRYICFWQPVLFLEKKLIDEEAKVDPRLNDKALRKIYKYTTDSLMAKSPSHFFDISNALSDRTESCYIDFCHLSEEGNELIASKIFQIFEREFQLDE